MRTLGNILWHFPCLGFLTALLHLLLGLLLVITIIGSPIGLGLIELSKFQMSPFTSVMIPGDRIEDNRSLLRRIFEAVIVIIYLPIGLILALATIIQIVLLVVTIVGIPAAIVLAKSLSTYFNPVGKKCVSRIYAEELERAEVRSKIYQ